MGDLQCRKTQQMVKMKASQRFFILVWILCFVCKSTAVRPPPAITKFSPKDLINPDEVKFEKPNAFSLPCQATGLNLTWTWKHNGTKIPYNSRYKLSADGTLTGSYLNAEHSGTYQCFVKDEETGVEVFSRKLQVAVTVVGEFINPRDVVQRVNLGQSFSFQCPEHKASFGVTFTWEGSQTIQFSRNKRRAISLVGGLYIMYVTQKDIDEIEENNGIKCKISGAGIYYLSGSLKLEKSNTQQTDPGNLNAPSWLVTPESQEIAIEGRGKTLYCLAKGRPEPSITWKKNGQQIIDGQNSFEIPASFFGRSLKIDGVNKTEHEGQYSCEAENSMSNGQPLIHTVNLVVEVAPRWTIAPPLKELDIVIERNGSLACHVTAVPDASITWYKDGRQLISSNDSLIIHKDRLEFRGVSLDSEGVYQCAAENKYGMIASATWVRVLAWKPSFSDVQFGPFQLLHESKGRLPCNPSAAPRPTFQWFRSGVLISYGDSSRYELEQDGTLIIKKVDKDMDAVNYTCSAKNFLGSDSATAVTVVLVRPSFDRVPTNQTVKEKGYATFQCTATGKPIPKITWFKGKSERSIGETLRFRVDRADSGKYWCEADNGLGFTIRDGAYLNVQYEPSFTVKPKDQIVEEQGTVSFNCDAIGNPAPEITWIKDGETIGNTSNLTFTASRNNSGKYWCLAKNELAAPIEDSAFLDVHYKPEDTQLSFSGPNISAVPFASEITFNCTSHARPDVQKYWFYKEQETLGFSETGVFRFVIKKPGSYSCAPVNSVGKGEEAAISIGVDGSPSPPSNLQVSDLDCNELTLKLSWIPGASNGAPIDYYLIEKESSGIPVDFLFIHNVTDPEVTEIVLNLTKRTVPRFRMIAFNKFGSSRPSIPTAEGICGTKAAKNPTDVVGLKQEEESPVYSKTWFVIVLALVGYFVLFVVVLILIRKYRFGRGHKYNVELRENKYGSVKYQNQERKVKTEENDEQNEEDEEGNTPFIKSNNPREKERPTSLYSASEENLFAEDFAFVDEYKEADVVFKYEKEGTFV
ncbi:fibronectin type III domain-containing protein-like isoform X1 [Porites lutea]|uniref:fibronectin type III domain-containing protein-like isoform X1 n=2 Tax=Porites lutea TaxID=51062 RepID=UPI003CC54223